MKHLFSYRGSEIAATEYFRAPKAGAAVYFHGGGETGLRLAEAAERLELDAALIGIDGEDWNRDLSPRPAPRAFRGGEDFAGGADEYLAFLCGTVLPQVERGLSGVERRALMGYSLAGLFAVYSLYRTDVFSAAASVSGSLWYDGFIELAGAERPARLPEAVYLSLGDRESRSRNPRMARVESRTEELRRILDSLGVKTVFELNPGGHFDSGEKRMERALVWLAENLPL